jgi:calcium permeable stress-gated cation channel
LRESERSPELPNGLFNWFGTFWRLPDIYVLQHQSLDAYLYLRFLRVIVIICFMGCVITWPVLFPVNATGGGGKAQLDILSYSNIDKSGNGQYRYFAHALIIWVYFGFIMYMITRECIFYINLRQAFLLSPIYSNRVSTRTVLFTSVPQAYQDEAKLRKVFGDTVRNIWINGDTKDLDKLVKNRDKAAYRLEKSEVKLIKLANKERQKAMKEGAAEDRADQQADAESGSVAGRWVPNKKRPTHKTGLLGLVGSKVDSINWCRTELQKLIPEAEAAQAKYRAGDYKKTGGVFIEFRTQAEAECAAQTLTHHHALHMAPRYIGITPGEVVWSAINLPWWQRLVRRYAVIAFISALIIFWAIPVAFVGILSNVQYLESISFLTWLTKIPTVSSTSLCQLPAMGGRAN